jgi:hypothetical protein
MRDQGGQSNELVNALDEYHDPGDVNLCLSDAVLYSFGKDGLD